MTITCYSAARIFTGDTMREGESLCVENGRIIAIGRPDELPAADRSIDLGGGVIAPGFVDLQVNGGGGALLNDTPDLATVRRIAESHRAFGTLHLLPTVITDSTDIITAAAGAVRRARDEGVSGILGIHIEGPFIDAARKGAHPPEFIRPMTDDDLRWLTSLDCGHVLVTLSPRQVSAAQIRTLAAHGVTVCLGHTEATAEEANVAFAAGARGVTHLFNAMSQLSARAGGLAGAALTAPDCFCGLIADGQHVGAEALAIALKMKGAARIALVSDAMPPAAGGPDEFALQGRSAGRKGARLELADGTLAGAAITLADAVRYLVGNGFATLADALRMATTTPAAFIGARNEIGRLARGSAADFVHLDDEGRLLSRPQAAAE